MSLQSIRRLKSGPSLGPHRKDSAHHPALQHEHGRGPVTHRVFRVATAVGLLIAPSSAAWAEVEDVGAPGPAILDVASGSSAIANRADALRFDDARFAFRDPSVGSTFLSVGGRFVPIVGAGLEPSQESQVDPGRPTNAFDYNLSEDYYLGAPDAIPATVKDFGAVDAIIQNDFMLNGAGDSFVTDPVGGVGYWTTTYGSLPFDLHAGPVGRSGLHASCSSDGSSSAVIRCEVLEIRNALGLPAGGEKGSDGSYGSTRADNKALAWEPPVSREAAPCLCNRRSQVRRFRRRPSISPSPMR